MVYRWRNFPFIEQIEGGGAVVPIWLAVVMMGLAAGLVAVIKWPA